MAGDGSSAWLATQQVGVDVVIDRVDGALDATRLRLCEMGLVPGTVVRVTRRAPLGDPLEVAVRGTRVVLRQADAATFIVRALMGPGRERGDAATAAEGAAHDAGEVR